MRTSFLYVICLLVCLTSCMGESGEKQYYFRNAVAMFDPIPCLYTTNGEYETRITSADFENMQDVKEGDCFQVEFKANLEDVNKDIHNVDIFKIETVPGWPLHKTLTDTTDTVIGEQLVTLSFLKSQYLKGRMFLISDHDAIREKEDVFDFSYDPERITEDINGRRIYDLYIRAIKKGGTEDTVATKWKQTSAFILDQFVADAKIKEEEAGRDSLFFRFKYLRQINTTAFPGSTVLTWSESGLYSYALSEIE